MTFGDNTAFTLFGVNDLRYEKKSVPKPAAGEVLLSMKRVGICGSDVHYWKHGRIGDFVCKDPMVIGHEAAGEVVALGEGVTSLSIGDRVAVEPGVPCRCCWYCKTGRYNLCHEMKFCATPPYDGSLINYYTHPADFCFKLPDNMSYEEAAMCEPLSVGIHACNKGDVGIGKTILVMGAGPIGLVNVLVAKAMGAARVIITDVVQSRLDVAKSLGADEVYKVAAGLTPEQHAAAIIAQLGGAAPEVTIECSGVESSVQTAVLATRSGGVVVLVGMGAATLNFPVINALCREVDIKGIFRYVNCYPKAISLISSGRVDVKPLITHRFKFAEALKAFEVAADPSTGAIKVMISVDE